MDRKRNIWIRLVTAMLITTFLCQDIVWAGRIESNCLAPESRLTPFFNRHKLNLGNIGALISVAGKLKDVIYSGDDGRIEAEINSLNENQDIKITEIKKYTFGCSQREIQYVVCKFTKENITINALFAGEQKFTPDELQELKIKDKEKHYLDCWDLENVWFIEEGKMEEIRKKKGERAEKGLSPVFSRRTEPRNVLVLLINPRALRQTEKPEKHPLSLLFLASILSNASYMQEFSRVYPDYKGKIPNIEVKILDLAAESSDFDLASYLKGLKPDIIGISSTTRFFRRASDISRLAQEIIPDTLRIVGGHHVTVLPRESLESSNFHAGVIGYGEETLIEIVILQALAKVQDSKIDFSAVKGIVYRTEDGKVVVNTPRNNKIPLGKAPSANTMIDLLNLDGYSKDVSFYLENGRLRGPLASVFTLQGCNFHCRFCANPAKKVRWRTPQDVVSEIGFLFEKGFRLIQIVDGNFSLNMKKAKKFCRLLIEQSWHKEIEWIASLRADFVDKELLQLMKEAGCAGIGLGLETGDEALLKAMNKGMKLNDIRSAIRLCKEVGLPVKLFVVVGYPGQDWLTIKKTAEFILETRPDSISVFPVVPWPGSQIYKDGMPMPVFLERDDWDQWCNRTEQSKRDSRFLAAFKTKEMTPEQIADARDLLKSVHSKIDDPHALRKILEHLNARVAEECARKKAEAEKKGHGPVPVSPETDVSEGAPATLLKYMYGYRDGKPNQASPIDKNNPKKSIEMAGKRGGKDSLRTIQRELKVLREAGLVWRNKNGYYLPDWVIALGIENIIKENPNLKKPGCISLNEINYEGYNILPVSKDIGVMMYLFNDISFDKDRRYRIKYDENRLSASQVEVIKQYSEELKKKGSANIQMTSFKNKRDYAIRIECLDEHGKHIGGSQIGIRALHYYPSRTVGILNMVFAASNVGNKYRKDDPMFKFIKRQYKLITGNEPDTNFDIRKITLPKPQKLDLNDADKLNKLAIQLLIAA